METLEKSRMCRLCGKQSGIAIDIFDKNESHVRKINAILPILVHEMDLLPKQMCHRCSYKLEEFYNFYVDCAKTDRELKSQLSWMSKDEVEEKHSIPMVKMNKFKIKTEPLDNDSVDPNNAFTKFGGGSLFFPASILLHGSEPNLMLPCSQCKCACSRSIKEDKTSKQIKVCSKSEAENKAHNSELIGKEACVLIESIDVDYKFKCANNLFKGNKFSEMDSHQTTRNSIGNETFIAPAIGNNTVKSEKLNRALRPRKNSVDYLGPRKKITATNLKFNVKNKLEYIDMSLVDPVDIRMNQGNANRSSPIIKLEKVDDPVKSLRTQQNLELFNKTIKELQRKKNRQSEHRHRKPIWMEVNTNQKNEGLKEGLNGSTKTKLQKEDVCKKRLKIEHKVEYDAQTEENVNENCSMKNYLGDVNNDFHTVEPKIKQEQMNKSTESNESMEEYSVQENRLKPVDMIPFCAVVKLEEDYTCNVDCPKIQIKWCSTDTNNMEPLEGGSKVPAKQNDNSKIAINKKCPVRNSLSNDLKSNERRKTKINNHLKTRAQKKNARRLNFNMKQGGFKKELPMVLHQTELKRYCEECNTSFANKELYKLHPCYQK